MKWFKELSSVSKGAVFALCLYFVLFLVFSVRPVLAQEIEVKQIVKEQTAKLVCPALEEGGEVVLRSPGGNVGEAMLLTECIREKSVTVKVEEAASAATFLVLAGKRVCFGEKPLIGFHSPYTKGPNGLVYTYGINELRRYSHLIGFNMKKWGYTDLEAYSIIGITLMTHSNDLRFLRPEQVKELLGGRFIGECK